MKRLLLGVLAFMLISTQAFAQEDSGLRKAFPTEPIRPALPGLVSEDKPFEINVKAVCGSMEQIEDILKPAGEYVFARLVAIRAAGPIPIPGNPAPAVITANPKSTSWSVIENLAPGVYCIVAGGPIMAPFGPGVGQKVIYNYKGK